MARDRAEEVFVGCFFWVLPGSAVTGASGGSPASVFDSPLDQTFSKLDWKQKGYKQKLTIAPLLSYLRSQYTLFAKISFYFLPIYPTLYCSELPLLIAIALQIQSDRTAKTMSFIFLTVYKRISTNSTVLAQVLIASTWTIIAFPPISPSNPFLRQQRQPKLIILLAISLKQRIKMTIKNILSKAHVYSI